MRRSKRARLAPSSPALLGPHALPLSLPCYLGLPLPPLSHLHPGWPPAWALRQQHGSFRVAALPRWRQKERCREAQSARPGMRMAAGLSKASDSQLLQGCRCMRHSGERARKRAPANKRVMQGGRRHVSAALPPFPSPLRSAPFPTSPPSRIPPAPSAGTVFTNSIMRSNHHRALPLATPTTQLYPSISCPA